MNAKKTEDIKIRITDGEKKALINLTGQVGLETVSQTVRLLITRAVSAHNEHGDRLIWPPQYNYYPASALNAQQSHNAGFQSSKTESLSAAS